MIIVFLSENRKRETNICLEELEISGNMLKIEVCSYQSKTCVGRVSGRDPVSRKDLLELPTLRWQKGKMENESIRTGKAPLGKCIG